MGESKVNMRGLKCPLPALRARKVLSGLAAGDLLVVECTDPLTVIDIPNLIRQTGDCIEDSSGAAYALRECSARRGRRDGRRATLSSVTTESALIVLLALAVDGPEHTHRPG